MDPPKDAPGLAAVSASHHGLLSSSFANGSFDLAFSQFRGLFEEFPSFDFRLDAGIYTFSFKTLKCGFDGLAIFKYNAYHTPPSKLLQRFGNTRTRQDIPARSVRKASRGHGVNEISGLMS